MDGELNNQHNNTTPDGRANRELNCRHQQNRHKYMDGWRFK